jgi:hypothetical protein
MKDGVPFPPVRVWFDGTTYWLSDGFHRIAACELIGVRQVASTIHQGTLAEAQWDSYRANSEHGLRHTSRDIRSIIRAALGHANAQLLSNVQISKHLNVPEATVRRWRTRLSSSRDEDGVRLVSRKGSSYSMNTSKIGRSGTRPRIHSGKELHRQIDELKAHSSSNARRLLNIINNWICGLSEARACLNAIESIIAEWTSIADTK